MRKLDWKKTISLTSIGIALGAMFGISILSTLPAFAAETKPVDISPPPLPPTMEECAILASSAMASAGKPGNATDIYSAELVACLQRYKIELSTFRRDASDYWYRREEQISQSFEFKVKLAAMGALLDTMAYFTTNFAYDTANMILGVDRPDGKPSFYEADFGDYLSYHADQASGVFFESFDAISQFSADLGGDNPTTFGFTTLCKKPSPLDIRLGLGMSDMGPLNGSTCTLSAMVDNFEAISDMVSSGDALNIHKATFEPYGNDLHVGLEIQSNYVDALLKEQERAKLSRIESEGMVPVIDKITQRIQWPSMMANEGMKSLEPTGMAQVQQDKQESYMVQAFWATGIEGLGILTLSTFLNRLAFGFLQKLLTPSQGLEGSVYGDTQKTSITFQNLINEDASGDSQNYYERQAFAKSLGDFIIPSFYSQEDKDLVTELATCPSIRSKWNCSLDQALSIAINLGTRDGALTIGKAAGIGSENSAFSPSVAGLHADWELIPESDIANNTDPSCYQRAYCAGNLKKLRLARILPVGFEMAANSPYNVKRAGRYITLGDVIRGFYDCNDEGKIDKEHPWCHLIDPNWILAAPKYQCLSKGYGETVIPELGSRQEECGDVVTCLGTNQAGECDKGYGYCLAERPAYKFDAQECKEQYASCRTYQSSKGEPLSALRYTVERGACSAENIGCMWFATNRYVTSSASPDGLWEGTLTEGSRIYLDGGAEPCSSEGCTKVYNFKPGESAFNLINNSSFEKVTEVEQNGDLVLQDVDAWDLQNAVIQNIDTTKESYDGTRGLSMDSSVGDEIIQTVRIIPNRNYTFSYYSINPGNISSGNIDLQFGNIDSATGAFKSSQGTQADIAFFEDCAYVGGNLLRLRAVNYDITPNEWQRNVCQFVSPLNSTYVQIRLGAGGTASLTFDALSLEEGEYVTDYVEELAELKESHIKIAPDEYQCTGNDDEDHPSCTNFARVCRQTEVGCQGYTDVNDPTAPEIPATLTAKDYCPKVCSGYGEYRKLASAFDLVYNPVYPQYSDPADDGKAYLIPNTSQSCTLQNVGCEPFTSLEASTAGGEQVAYYDSLRTCQKPNDLSRTYFTWEGSDNEGYVLRTWALIASTTSNNAPKIVLKGASFGDIKDPDSCNEDLWDSGIDQDCRQFYDETGAVYYAYYSQTVSSDSACTLYRKDDSSEIDCTKTGGHEFVPQSGSCLYYALPSESSICPATAGGCRAYLGPTGRNAVQTYYQSFMDDGSESAYKSGLNSTISRSEESVLVGDYSLRVDSVGGSNVQVQTDIPVITTTTLYRISFWAKSLGSDEVSVTIDGNGIGSFTPTTIWQRFEIGPFEVGDTTSTLAFSGPSAMGSLFIDTIKLDQLNDIRFLIKNSGTIPATCDATIEGTPEPRAMLGCNEYVDRDGNQIFARNFSNLCRADSIGCKAFIDTRSVSNPYPESRTITGTPGPSTRKDGDARTYEEQYLGEWSITSQPWRYYYAIDDSRARCDESQDSCRAFGKPHFAQDRLSLKETGYTVDPANTELLKTQDAIYEFETVLLKHNWDAYYNNDGSLNLACRKDELHCDKYQSGNVTEYFRNPGDHTCEWRDAKQLDANPDIGIYTAGTYGGWFRKGTDTPCYPGDTTETPPKSPYLKNGDNFGAYFTGEDPYSGWVSGCPIDQSECTEFIDPNDTSDSTHPLGRSYFLVNSRQLDTQSCGYEADPLTGCILFNNKSINDLQANSQATYKKSNDQRGAPQSPIDCNNDPENPYCKVCVGFEFKNLPTGANPTTPGEFLSVLLKNENNSLKYYKELLDYEKKLQIENYTCKTNEDCLVVGSEVFPYTAPTDIGYAVGTCGRQNDSNVIIKVKLDRECARWMGCRTGETVYDPSQQKYINQCSELELCEKMGSRNDGVYCEQFSDRNQEDFLNAGQLVTADSYSSRSTGFGSLDYAGFTIPNQYLLADLEVRSVGSDLFADPDKQNQYRYDQRLVAEISMDSPYIEVIDPTTGSADKVCRDHVLISCSSYGCEDYQYYINKNLGQACVNDSDCSEFLNIPDGYNVQGKCGLSLCQDTRTKRIGYQDIIKNVCVLAINEPQAYSFVSGGQTGNDLSRDIGNLYQEYVKDNISSNNALLQSAMPSPECQLFPESTSPLSNEYVETWNTDAVPPVPEKMLTGYENAGACVYGEECSCSYRKVRYKDGAYKYYSVNGAAPSVGVCSGGQNDGQACVPGGYIPVDSDNRILASVSQLNPLSLQGSCTGGTCMAIQDVVFLNGQYGYCLERDRTQGSDISKVNAPCLTWSPLSVLGGRFDTTHFSPTAGYLPPQGSGEYYCVSGANEQRLETPSTFMKYEDGLSHWGDYFWAPGQLEDLAFSRANVWWNKAINQYSNKSIDGRANTSGSPDEFKGGQTQTLMYACRRASLCEGFPVSSKIYSGGAQELPWASGSSLDSNEKEGRWIMTGNSVNQSYLEYFVPYIPRKQDGPEKQVYTRNEDAFDFKFGLFRFRLEPFAAGSACKWNPGWLGMSYPAAEEATDGGKFDIEKFSCQSYLNEVKTLSDQFSSLFNQAFPGVLDRTSEKLYTDEQDQPIQLGCVENTDKSCYYKYWETGFRYTGAEEAFTWPGKQQTNFPDSDQFNFAEKSRQNVFYGKECGANNPYFAIRAMFQNMNPLENSLEPEETRVTKLSGPWQFVGFWVTTCLPNKTAGDPGWLYLRLDTIRTDVCREVGQVVSPLTRENAAFADRVWSQGRFLMPALGLTYGSRNEPFGSALATREIGHDPMIMGASVPLSSDPALHPVFVDSGVGQQTILMDQQSAWAPLTNLFARVYKIYRWESSLVLAGDWSCVDGVNRGKLCGPSVGDIGNHYDGLKTCSGYASCDPNVDTDVKNLNWRCNTLSGVNRGLSCGDELPRNTDVVCHNAARAVDYNPDVQDEDAKDLLAHCGPPTAPWDADFVLTPEDLSNMGVCKDNNITNCQILNVSKQAPNTFYSIENVDNVCTPNITTVVNDQCKNYADPNYCKGLINTNTHLSQCLYSSTDTGPKLTFKIQQCPNGIPEFYLVPQIDGIKNYVTTLNSPLPIIYYLAYNASSAAKAKCGGTSGGTTEAVMYEQLSKLTPLVNFSGLENTLKGWFPSIPANEKIKPSFIKGLALLWNPNTAQTYAPEAKLTANFGPYSKDTISNIAMFRCETRNGIVPVNEGARCGMYTLDEDGGTYDCPRQIKACTGNTLNDSQWVAGFKGQIPSCGFCTKGTSYENLDPFKNEDQFEGTGYCLGFNKLSRCNSHADCKFTEYEFWGARDTGGASGVEYGAGELNLYYSIEDAEEGKAYTSAAANKTIKLPTPLFQDIDDKDFDGNTNENITEVPQVYSNPAIWTATGNGRAAHDLIFGMLSHCDDRENCQSPVKKSDLNWSGDDDENSFSVDTECQQCNINGYSSGDTHGSGSYSLEEVGMGYQLNTLGMGQILCPIKPMETICRALLEFGSSSYCPFGQPTGLFSGNNADYSGYGDDPTQGDGDPEQFWCKQALITEVIYRCYKSCSQMALLYPNSYASNFDQIAQANIAASNNGTNRRQAAVAPFAINPLIRTLKSLGYLVDSVGKDSDTGDEKFWPYPYQLYMGWMQGKMFSTWVGYGANNTDHTQFSASDASLGSKEQIGYTFPVGKLITIPTNNYFDNVITGGGYNFRNGILAIFLGISHIQEIADKTIEELGTNDRFPWDESKIYFTTLFPLAFDNPSPRIFGALKTNDANLDANYGAAVVPYDQVWSGYGFSDDLFDKFNIVLKEYIANNSVELKKATTAFTKQYKKDMKDNYFSETGWGVFIDSSLDPQGNANVEQLNLYPGAMPAAVPAVGNEDKKWTVFIPGHCEPPPGGTDIDSFSGETFGVNNIQPLVYTGIPKYAPYSWFGSRWVKSPWKDIPTIQDILDSNIDPPLVDSSGFVNPGSYEWTPAGLDQNTSGDSADIKMPGPVGANMQAARSTCRCEGGTLDGQIVEAEVQCNPGMEPYQDPANYNALEGVPDWQYCKPATAYGPTGGYGSYKDIISHWLGLNDPVSGLPTGIDSAYLNALVIGEPIPECKQQFGTPGHANPDLDNNRCTHLPGYLPRGDVCADDRPECLITYDLTDKKSINHKSLEDKSVLSATDVTFGLDAFKYLSGGNENQSGKEYIAWYRPRPPAIAAPDITKQSQSANSLLVSQMDAFNFNGRPEGLTYFGGGQGLSVIQFYAWTAHNQGPVKNIVIDWGDGTVQRINDAQMKNRKPVCNTDRECEFVPGLACSGDADCPAGTGACLPTGMCKNKSYLECHSDDDCGQNDQCITRTFFGNSSEACQQGYFEFKHIYKCDGQTLSEINTLCDTANRCEDEPDLACSSCRSGEDCVSGLAPRSGCYNETLNRCRYTPRIMIVDNWGWCTGDCSQVNEAVPGGPAVSRSQLVRHPNGGCWDGSNTKINMEVVDDPEGAITFANECQENFTSASQQNIYRPWIVYDGSVEVSPADDIRVVTGGSGGTWQLFSSKIGSTTLKFKPF